MDSLVVFLPGQVERKEMLKCWTQGYGLVSSRHFLHQADH